MSQSVREERLVFKEATSKLRRAKLLKFLHNEVHSVGRLKGGTFVHDRDEVLRPELEHKVVVCQSLHLGGTVLQDLGRNLGAAGQRQACGKFHFANEASRKPAACPALPPPLLPDLLHPAPLSPVIIETCRTVGLRHAASAAGLRQACGRPHFNHEAPPSSLTFVH